MTERISMPGETLSPAKKTINRFAGAPGVYDIWGRPRARIPTLAETIESGMATFTRDTPRMVVIGGVLTEIPANIALVVDGAVFMAPDNVDCSEFSYERIVKKTDKCWYVTEKKS